MARTRTAMITGATGGIGQAVTKLLSKHGYNVVVCYNKNQEIADNLVTYAKKYSNAIAVQADLKNGSEVETCFKKAREYFGKIDVLVTCAGVAHYQSFQDMTEDDFDYVCDTNFKSTALTISKAIPDMLKLGWGRIVSISSIWGEIGGSGEVLYSATKSAVSGIVKALSKELAPSGITVNAIAPGVVDTNMLDHFKGAEREYLLSQIPVGRFCTPEEVASLVCHLVSDDSAYITGEVIRITGGFGE